MEILSKLKWIKKTEITLPYDPGLILVETCMSYWWHQEVHLGKVAAMVQKESQCTFEPSNGGECTMLKVLSVLDGVFIS